MNAFKISLMRTTLQAGVGQDSRMLSESPCLAKTGRVEVRGVGEDREGGEIFYDRYKLIKYSEKRKAPQSLIDIVYFVQRHTESGLKIT